VTCHKFYERHTLVFDLKNNVDYIISVPSIFFKFNPGTKVHFCWFLVSSQDIRDRGCQILTIKREIRC
jgi:hypothetical protein